MAEETFTTEQLLINLDKAYEKAKNDYFNLLFAGDFSTAAEKLTLLDMIDLHRNRVEEL